MSLQVVILKSIKILPFLLSGSVMATSILALPGNDPSPSPPLTEALDRQQLINQPSEIHIKSLATDTTREDSAGQLAQTDLTISSLRIQEGDGRLRTKAVEAVTGAVVRVRCLVGLDLDEASIGKLKLRFEYGTGVIVGEEGLILTAQHLLRRRHQLPDEVREIEIMTQEALGYLPAEVLAENEVLDLALLRVPPRFLHGEPRLGVDLNSVERPPPSNERIALVIGIRAGAPPESFEAGILAGTFTNNIDELIKVGGTRYNEHRDQFLTISQRIFRGYSGGAILTEEGQLVGILIGAPYHGDEWLGFSFGVRIEAIDTLFKTDDTERN